MKINKNWALAVLALVISGAIWFKAAKADQIERNEPRQRDVIMFYVQGGGLHGLSAAYYSTSPGIDIKPGTEPATIISDALSNGYTMRVDNLLVTLVR